jgi:hypothetical protein
LTVFVGRCFKDLCSADLEARPISEEFTATKGRITEQSRESITHWERRVAASHEIARISAYVLRGRRSTQQKK